MTVYKTVVFDIDGTLIDSEDAVMTSLQRVLKQHYGREMDRRDLAFIFGIPGSDSLPRLGIEDTETAKRLWNEYMVESLHMIRVFEGVETLLAALKERSVTMGVVTSKTRQEYRNEFAPLGLAHYMDVVVCADDTERHKPHPDPLLKFLERSGADAGSALYIGDTIYDGECARDAGVDFGLALWGCRQPEGIPAKHKLAHPMDILGLIDP